MTLVQAFGHPPPFVPPIRPSPRGASPGERMVPGCRAPVKRGIGLAGRLTPGGRFVPVSTGCSNDGFHGRRASGNSLPAGCFRTGLLPMAAPTLSRRVETVFRRHAPPAGVLVLKICTCDLMTRSAIVAREPADRNNPQSVETPAVLGNSVGSSRSDVRPNTATAPALGPGHKVEAALRPGKGAFPMYFSFPPAFPASR